MKTLSAPVPRPVRRGSPLAILGSRAGGLGAACTLALFALMMQLHLWQIRPLLLWHAARNFGTGDGWYPVHLFGAIAAALGYTLALWLLTGWEIFALVVVIGLPAHLHPGYTDRPARRVLLAIAHGCLLAGVLWLWRATWGR